MKLSIQADHLDIKRIMDSGQVFRIRQIQPDQYLIISGDHAVSITSEENSGLLHLSCTPDEFYRYWNHYFDLETDYERIKASIDPCDLFLKEAIAYGKGIRILRQDLWEVIISFLISQNNNIARIRTSIESLCQTYGKPLAFHTENPLYAFPSPASLSSRGLEGLQGMGLGYRDKYILAMAEKCVSQEGILWLKEVRAADYKTALTLLTSQPGIGRKVADCICLFGLHHIEAFPIDTHVRQILETYYPSGFPFSRYQGYAGILQQYMFYYKLSLKRSSSATASKKKNKWNG